MRTRIYGVYEDYQVIAADVEWVGPEGYIVHIDAGGTWYYSFAAVDEENGELIAAADEQRLLMLFVVLPSGATWTLYNASGA